MVGVYMDEDFLEGLLKAAQINEGDFIILTGYELSSSWGAHEQKKELFENQTIMQVRRVFVDTIGANGYSFDINECRKYNI